jgi:2-methylisocitrate lyase-like PEP mutase family enzyme
MAAPEVQAERYEAFLALHARPTAFIMPNVWDGASAALMAQAGFEAVASSSLAFAATLGVRDDPDLAGRQISVDHAALLGRIARLPVNGDLVDGYGPAPEDCVATVEASIAAGLAGLGIEDTTNDPADPIHAFDHAIARIAAAARAARGRIVLTGRTDNLLYGRPDLDDTIRRLTAFAEVGADVLYAPGLPDMDAIRAVVRAVAPKPVNVVVGPGVALADLEAAGVRRVSLGGALYRRALGALRDAAADLKAGDIPRAVAGALPGSELRRWLG